MADSLGEPELLCQGKAKPHLFSIALMTNRRRDRFVAYFNGPPFRGDRAKFMAKTGLSKGRVSQLLSSSEVFGEVTARRIAGKLGLDPDYFESDQGVQTADVRPIRQARPGDILITELGAVLSEMSDLQRKMVAPLFQQLVEKPETAAELAQAFSNLLGGASDQAEPLKAAEGGAR